MSSSRQKTSLSTASIHTLNQQPITRLNKGNMSMSGGKPANGGYGLFDGDDDATSSRSSSKIAVSRKTTTTTTTTTVSKPLQSNGSTFVRNADFSKSLSGIPSASTSSASSINRPSASARSRLVAPRIKTGAAASRHSPYSTGSRRVARPPPARMEDEPKFAPLKEVHRSPEQPATPEKQKNKTPEQANTWAKWTSGLGFFSTGKKAPTADQAPAGGSFLGKLLFPLSKKEEQPEEEDKKRYSLPGSFEDVDEKENREQPAADADPYLNPYKKLEAASRKEVSQSFSGVSSTPNRGLMSPRKNAPRGVASSFDESKLRTARYNFHPYNRSANSPRLARYSQSRTVSISPTGGVALTEEERIKLSTEEELRAIEQRKRDRYVQEQEDRYRLRAVAKKMGKKLEDIMDTAEPADDYLDEEMPSSQETQPDESAASPAPAAIEDKKPERRGFGLFDDSDEEMEEIDLPAPSPRKRSPTKSKSSTPSSALPFSDFKPSDNLNTNIPTLTPSEKLSALTPPTQPNFNPSKSSSPSPDSDKENNATFFNEPIPALPPAPHPAHATLPKGSSAAAPAKPAPQTPAPTAAKLKTPADKFRPAVPSNLRASTTAGNASPPKKAGVVRQEVEAIPEGRLIAYRFPAVKAGSMDVDVLKAVQSMWNEKGGMVGGFMAEFELKL